MKWILLWGMAWVLWGHALADLEILHRQKNFSEYIDHFLDVLPTLRNEKWEKMTLEMANLWIKDILGKKQFGQENKKILEKLNTQKILDGDEFFQRKREKFLLGYLARCTQEGPADKCLKELDEFWTSTHQDGEFSALLSPWLEQFFPHLSHYHYLRPAFFASPAAAFYCQKKHFREVFWERASIILARQSRGPADAFQEHVELQSIAGKDCLQGLRPFLKEKMFHGQNIVEQEEAFRISDDIYHLATEEKELFLVVYLLSGPLRGDTFNRAWNLVQRLSADEEKRSQMTKKLLQMKFLPDGLLEEQNEEKKRVLMEYLGTNLPEYWQGLAQACVDYYGSKRDFPQGAPALHCREFFRLGNGKSWGPPAELAIEFKNAFKTLGRK